MCSPIEGHLLWGDFRAVARQPRPPSCDAPCPSPRRLPALRAFAALGLPGGWALLAGRGHGPSFPCQRLAQGLGWRTEPGNVCWMSERMSRGVRKTCRLGGMKGAQGRRGVRGKEPGRKGAGERVRPGVVGKGAERRVWVQKREGLEALERAGEARGTMSTL